MLQDTKPTYEHPVAFLYATNKHIKQEHVLTLIYNSMKDNKTFGINVTKKITDIYENLVY